ncbi:MAG: hypothetical protein ACLFMZ_07000 [Spirochaetaceae bacterium]
MSEEKEEDRLEKVEELFKRKKKWKNQLCWIKYNPLADYKYDIQNAEEDFEWMVYEIKRLREENAQYREFIDTMRSQLEEEMGKKG